MRELERMDRILPLVREAWLRFPDQRLGQLLINACRELPGWPDIWSVEDDELELRLREMLEDPV